MWLFESQQPCMCRGRNLSSLYLLMTSDLLHTFSHSTLCCTVHVVLKPNWTQQVRYKATYPKSLLASSFISCSPDTAICGGGKKNLVSVMRQKLASSFSMQQSFCVKVSQIHSWVEKMMSLLSMVEIIQHKDTVSLAAQNNHNDVSEICFSET